MKPEDAPAATLKRRKIPLPQRLWAWYRRQRLLNKVALWVIIASIPLAVVAAQVARPLYRSWKQRNALALADKAMRENDQRAAMLAFRRAITADPSNPEVWTKLASYLDAANATDAGTIWERAAAIVPESVEYPLRAATSFLQQRDWRRARANLDRIPPEQRNRADYIILLARAETLAGRTAVSRALLADLVRREPENTEAAFELDVTLLAIPGDPERQAANLRMRERARSDSAQRTRALRELVVADVAADALVLANSTAAELARQPDATINDRLMHLNLELVTRSLSAALTLQSIRERLLTHPNDAPAITGFLAAQGLAAETFTWLERQPADKLESPEVIDARLQLALFSRNWDRAYALMAQTNPPMPAELREKLPRIQAAFRADQADAADQWNALVTESRGDLPRLLMLNQVATAWGWPAAQEKVLWTVSEAIPSNPRVWRELLRLIIPTGNTPALLQVLEALSKAEPSNVEARSLWIGLNFLLQKGDRAELLRLAESDARSSDFPDAKLVYAALLADAGRVDDALAVLAQIPVEVQRRPRVAAYVSYVHARARDVARADEFAGVTLEPQADVLAEERELAERSKEIARGHEAKAIEREALPVDSDVAQGLLRRLRSELGASPEDRAKLLEEIKAQSAGSGSSADEIERLKRELESEKTPPAVPPGASPSPSPRE